MSELPPNVQEFNLIAGLIFAQLYKAFPVRIDLIDRQAIAEAMGVEGNDWSAHKLASGRSFSEVLGYTISWLTVEDFINSSGSHPAERVALSTKGLAAMNAVPAGLKEALGPQLTKAAENASSTGFGAVGELMGGFVGGFAKTMSGG